MKVLKIVLKGWFPLELYDHFQKGSAVFVIIWKSLVLFSMIVAICVNPVSELRLTFSVAIDSVESLQLLHEGKASA